MTPVVEVENLVKRYGGAPVVDRLSFAVEAGEIFGLVGPNGAGKTTTVECAEGLRRPDAGRVRTLGLDPARATRRLHERIGIQLQESNLPARIRVGEALELFAAFYRRAADPRLLLESLGLGHKRDSGFATLSGGERQRLFIALALINEPEVVFLDELTTGLDPHARRAIWDLVLEIRERGTTVVLTTHFMEEAERLCDRVAILDHGRIVALDSPDALIRGLGRGSRLVLSIDGRPDLERLAALPGVRHAHRVDGKLVVEGESGALASDLLRALADGGLDIHDLATERGSLEDVFLALTGRAPEAEEAA